MVLQDGKLRDCIAWRATVPHDLSLS